MGRISLAVGGLLVENGNVLLVQVTYGANKGKWMMPGGLVEEGESLEHAVQREVMEETGLQVRPGNIIGMRSGVRETERGLETNVYVVFRVERISDQGEPAADGREISAVAFREIEEAQHDKEIIDLARGFIQTLHADGEGLRRNEQPIHTLNRYVSYDVYSICGSRSSAKGAGRFI